ncbi:MAG: serpin family protein [Clostridium sp.]|nr:serpin family protein [Clostridium sp.]
MGCSNDEPSDGKANSDNSYERITLSRAESTVANANHNFAWRFFEKASEDNQGKNICISPLSTSISLMMILNGAGGETREEIINVLGLDDMSVDEINECSHFMVTKLINRDKECALSVANSMWMSESLPIKEGYKKALQENFDAEAFNLDMRNFSKEANKWCSKKTNRLIDNLIKEGESYDFALINALYYRNLWADHVKFESKGQQTFTNCDGTKSSASYMKAKNVTCRYGEGETWRTAHIPFGNGAYYMSITLPNVGVDLDECISDLGEKFRNYMNVKLDITMPKFEAQGELNIINSLRSLGIRKAFDPREADFRYVSDIDTYINTMKQGCNIKVDEKGAEAAAVTITGFYTTSNNPLRPDPIVVDRPFIFSIYECSTNSILFVGKVEMM